MIVGIKKLESLSIPDGENRTILWSLVLTHCHPQCGRQTDKRTDTLPLTKSRSSVAERDRNKYKMSFILHVLDRVISDEYNFKFWLFLITV